MKNAIQDIVALRHPENDRYIKCVTHLNSAGYVAS